MRSKRSNIATDHGGRTASVAFRVWTYRHAAVHHVEFIGEVIDASCPQTDEVAALYLIDTPEGVLPFRKKVSPNALPTPLLTLQHALVGRTHGLPRNALGVCVVFNRALDALLMHHVSLGVIWIMTKRPI